MPEYLHLVFKAHGGAHDVGGPTADFKGEEVVLAGLAETTLGLRGLWGVTQQSREGAPRRRGLSLLCSSGGTYPSKHRPWLCVQHLQSLGGFPCQSLQGSASVGAAVELVTRITVRKGSPWHLC